jgi:outer membrane receptor protein involved in Fe transport
MNMKGKLITLGISICSYFSFSQVTGVVLDKASNAPILGAKVIASDGVRAITDFDGKFKLNSQKFPITIVTSMLQYVNDTTVVNAAGNVTIKIGEPVKDLDMVVVSAGRRKQSVEEVPVSMEIIRPQLIDNKGIVDLEQAVDQTPGVFTMDGQVSIRGGSGYAYGTGSRVLLLWNGMPLLSGYAGDTQWNAIPMEQASQIEVMKGASSVLYGSGALNGVISLQEKEPGLKPETKFKVAFGYYGKPKRESLKWWGNVPPMNQQIEAYRGQMYKRWGYTVSSTFFNNDGYRQGESEFRGRLSGTLYFKPVKIDRLKAGMGYNVQFQKTGSFLIWESDSLGYQPSGGVDPNDSNSTLNYSFGRRMFFDPYVKYIDKKNNRHSLKTRAYWATNEILNNPDQSNGAVIFFTDYNFAKQFGHGINLTSGISNIYNIVNSNLFGDHTSNNVAIYSQYEQNIGKFDLSAGLRLEYFEMNGQRGDSDFRPFKNNQDFVVPVYPVLRTGLHYEIAKYSHLRASIGQGIRYPSVAERFTTTSVGALNIFKNPDLRPEIGWAGELGFKQGVKIGDWKGMFDVAGFINEYNNMIEFTFGIYNPITGNSINLESTEGMNEYLGLLGQGYGIANLLGFRALNAEAARITGIDLSFNSFGNIGEIEIISLIGYTYMNPISLNRNPEYLAGNSDTTENLLKYRFKHLAKADVEVNYKKFSTGISMRYNSFMRNIDRIFEEAIAGTYILPGLKNYRQVYNGGNLVFDFRLGYKINDSFRLGLMCNNILNAEVTSRPGDIQPPRNYQLQLQMKF